MALVQINLMTARPDCWSPGDEGCLNGIPFTVLSVNEFILTVEGQDLPTSGIVDVCRTPCPTGTLFTGTLPTGTLIPTGTLPTGDVIPTGTLPTGGVIPTGTLPTGGIIPTGTVPAGTFPATGDPGGTTPPDVLSGMVAWAEFEEGSGTIVSDTIAANDGTAFGGMAWVIGKVGSFAGSFDGTDDFVNISAMGNVISKTTHTISMWFKPSVNLDSGTGGDPSGYPPSDSKMLFGQWHRWNLFYDQGQLIYRIYDGTAYVTVAFSTTIPSGGWHHVVGTWEAGNEMVLYLDGVAVGTSPSTGVTIGTVGADYYLGRKFDNAGDTSHWSGAIDDFRAYNRVLSPAEVLQIYNLYN